MGRRRFLVAAESIAGVAALSCCSGAGDTEGFDGSEFPVVEQWLTEAEVGGPDDTYDGTVSDGRGREEVRVDVGVDGNGGTCAYDPSAIAVSPGTTIRWVWVDDRERHNVAAAPDRQLGESDYEFRSGGPTIEARHEFARTLDREAIALYHSEGIAGSTWRTGGRVRGGRLGGPNRFSPRAPAAPLHLEPHRAHGMKGGIAVTE
jgi:plastocyanin